MRSEFEHLDFKLFKEPHLIKKVEEFFRKHNYSKTSIKIERPMISNTFKGNVDEITFEVLKGIHFIMKSTKRMKINRRQWNSSKLQSTLGFLSSRTPFIRLSAVNSSSAPLRKNSKSSGSNIISMNCQSTRKRPLLSSTQTPLASFKRDSRPSLLSLRLSYQIIDQYQLNM